MSDQEKINYIVDTFDFEKVRAFMLLTGHKWGGSTPTINNLKNLVRSYLLQMAAREEETIVIHKGGFFFMKRKVSGYIEFLVACQIEEARARRVSL